MTDRDHLEPFDPAGPRRRRPGARALGSVSDTLARLVPRPRGDDGRYDSGTGLAMSDEELREAFRLASLTVTPAPLGRPSRKPEATEPDDEASTLPSEGTPGAAEPAIATGEGGAGTAARASLRSPDAPAVAVVSSAAAGPVDLASRPPSAWAPPPGESPAADAVRTPAIAPAPEAALAVEPLPEPAPADEVQLPGNLGFSVDDFFGGLVRRVERRP